MSDLFLAPHHDDEALFGAFTLLRHRPRVAVVYAGGPRREAETDAACEILGCTVEHWRLPLDAGAQALTDRIDADLVFAPMWETGGQPQHNEVASAVANSRSGVRWYSTYTPAGKTVTAHPVPFEPEWIGLKLRALACYVSQFGQPGRAVHFLRDQSEFYA